MLILLLNTTFDSQVVQGLPPELAQGGAEAAAPHRGGEDPGRFRSVGLDRDDAGARADCWDVADGPRLCAGSQGGAPAAPGDVGCVPEEDGQEQRRHRPHGDADEGSAGRDRGV